MTPSSHHDKFYFRFQLDVRFSSLGINMALMILLMTVYFLNVFPVYFLNVCLENTSYIWRRLIWRPRNYISPWFTFNNLTSLHCKLCGFGPDTTGMIWPVMCPCVIEPDPCTYLLGPKELTSIVCKHQGKIVLILRSPYILTTSRWCVVIGI